MTNLERLSGEELREKGLLRFCAGCKRWRVVLATDWPYCLACYKARRKQR